MPKLLFTSMNSLIIQGKKCFFKLLFCALIIQMNNTANSQPSQSQKRVIAISGDIDSLSGVKINSPRISLLFPAKSTEKTSSLQNLKALKREEENRVHRLRVGRRWAKVNELEPQLQSLRASEPQLQLPPPGALLMRRAASAPRIRNAPRVTRRSAQVTVRSPD